MEDQVRYFIICFTSILYEALPFIVLGALIAGVLEELVPQELIARLVPRNRPLARFCNRTWPRAPAAYCVKPQLSAVSYDCLIASVTPRDPSHADTRRPRSPDDDEPGGDNVTACRIMSRSERVIARPASLIAAGRQPHER